MFNNSAPDLWKAQADSVSDTHGSLLNGTNVNNTTKRGKIKKPLPPANDDAKNEAKKPDLVLTLEGQGLKKQIDPKICLWYIGPAFIPFSEELPQLNRNIYGPFIMPTVDKYKDMGTVVLGKVESSECKTRQSLIIMPNRSPVTVDQLWSDDDEIVSIVVGENVKVKVKGLEEENVSRGFVLCNAGNSGRISDAQVVILKHKFIICAETGEKSKTRPSFVKQNQIAIMRIECAGVICLEEI